MQLPERLQNVIHYFQKLPGVGEKTATRQALQMSRWDAEDLSQFASALQELRNLRFCKDCGNFCDKDLCLVCEHPKRKQSAMMCVVESISDLMAIEKSGDYHGVYHVLGGVLNPLAGVGPEQLKISRLISRINELRINEVILAINPSVEGDATCSFIRDKISEDVKVERIGFGIPIGGSLEYLDSLTIAKAMEYRRSF